MDAYQVLRLIEQINDTGSRADKERHVAELAASDLGLFVLKWAYDPMITFGLTPALTKSADKLNIPFKINLVEKLLQRLSQRELTGAAAELEVAEVMQAFDKDGAQLLFLILSKDLKCGIAAATINLAVPGLIPVFAVARANAYEAKKVKSWPAKAEFKLDGNRNTFLARSGQGGFFTRTGKIVPALGFLVPPVLKAARFILDAKNDAGAYVASDRLRAVLSPNGTDLEFVLDGEAMMGLFGETGAFRRTEADALGAELHLYDMMSFADFDAPGAVGHTLEIRREILVEFVRMARTILGENGAIQIVPQFFVNNDEEAQAFFEKARAKTLASYLARGNSEREAELLKVTIDVQTGKPKVLEGAIIKALHGLYEKKKHNNWLKIKAEETEDLRVVGFFNGKANSKYEDSTGGLIVRRIDAATGNPVNVHVGGGFSDDERVHINELWLADAAKFGLDPKPGYKGIVVDTDALTGPFELLTRLLETEFHEVTPDGSLRHPRAIRFRDDKDGEIEDKELAA